MARSKQERRYLTERYLQRQIKREAKRYEIRDYERRPFQTFEWRLMGYDQYDVWDKYQIYTINIKEKQTLWAWMRKHPAHFCPCRQCRHYSKRKNKSTSKWMDKVRVYKYFMLEQEDNEIIRDYMRKYG